jgi:integrase
VRVWVAQWWEGDSRRSKVLGHCSQLSQTAARIILDGILRPINEGTTSVACPVLTFGEFVEQVYLPHCRRTWKDSTDLTSTPTINNHLTATFRDRFLTSISRDEMQEMLEVKAASVGKSIVGHLRWHLNAIFKLAESDGLVDHNPAAELRIPKNCKPGKEGRPLDETEVNEYLAVLDLPERLMARLAIFSGLRPGEILAVRWGSFDGDFIRIRERVYQGRIDTPKSGKAREAAIPEGTLMDAREWQKLARSTSPEAFVFPSENPQSPLDMGNLWRRTFGPRLEKVGLKWATFQILRKTNASLSKKHGIDAKVSADQRGHGLGVSMEVYTISDREQKREAVKRLESAVARKHQQKLSA